MLGVGWMGGRGERYSDHTMAGVEGEGAGRAEGGGWLMAPIKLMFSWEDGGVATSTCVESIPLRRSLRNIFKENP